MFFLLKLLVAVHDPVVAGVGGHNVCDDLVIVALFIVLAPMRMVAALVIQTQLHLIHILFEKRYCTGALLIDRSSLRREKLNDFAVSKLLVVVGICYVEQLLYRSRDAHSYKELPELILTENAIVVCVKLFE